MPRRIPDYPDGFLGWNMIASVGSYITAAGLVFFLLMLWISFVGNKTNEKKEVSINLN